jgi:hypothetical protein
VTCGDGFRETSGLVRKHKSLNPFVFKSPFVRLHTLGLLTLFLQTHVPPTSSLNSKL